ncbi:MAG: universal stress protein [Bacteroidales bacterium]|nr:universal stress protein [Bacteroidales bacterium]
MKNIIVPIDFSEDSLDGLRMAVLLANKFESRVQMVYVQSPSSELGRVGFAEEKRKAVQRFESLKSEFGSMLHDADKLDYIVKKGKVYREVVNQGQAFTDSIIVSSTHGASGFEEFFIGSNAFKIISAAEKPVITVRHGTTPREIKNIVLPIDSSTETRQKLPATVQIASAFGAEVHVLGVTSTTSQDIENRIMAYSRQVCKYLADQNIKHSSKFIPDTNTVDSTISYAMGVSADLISIMTEQNDSLVDYVLGTSAQHMLNKSPIPVMSITPKELFILGSFRTSGAPY